MTLSTRVVLEYIWHSHLPKLLNPPLFFRLMLPLVAGHLSVLIFIYSDCYANPSKTHNTVLAGPRFMLSISKRGSIDGRNPLYYHISKNTKSDLRDCWRDLKTPPKSEQREKQMESLTYHPLRIRNGDDIQINLQ